MLLVDRKHLWAFNLSCFHIEFVSFLSKYMILPGVRHRPYESEWGSWKLTTGPEAAVKFVGADLPGDAALFNPDTPTFIYSQ